MASDTLSIGRSGRWMP